MAGDAIRNLTAFSAQIALVIAAGGSLPWLLRVRAPGAAYGYYRFLLGLCVLLPALQPWTAPASAVPAILQAVTPQSVFAILPRAPGSTPGSIVPTLLTRSPQFLLLLAAAGALARLSWIAVGGLRLRRLRR